MTYRVKIYTGPTEVRQRAAYAREGCYTTVHLVSEGTEHIYLDLDAPNAAAALELARTESGYVSGHPLDARDCVMGAL